MTFTTFDIIEQLGRELAWRFPKDDDDLTDGQRTGHAHRARMRNIRRQLIRIGMDVIAMLRRVAQGFGSHAQLDEATRRIKQMGLDLDDHCFAALSHRAALVEDIRLIAATLRMTTDLERMAGILAPMAAQPDRLAGRASSLTDAAAQVQAALEAFATSDKERARRLYLAAKDLPPIDVPDEPLAALRDHAELLVQSVFFLRR